MKKIIYKGLPVLMLITLLTSILGCSNNPPINTIKNPEYPFDTTKAYYHHRTGVIAGGNCIITASPDEILTYYSYTEYPPKNECGMADLGADLFFVGLKEGKAKVTIEYFFPTTEGYSESFMLYVDKDLKVTACNE